MANKPVKKKKRHPARFRKPRPAPPQPYVLPPFMRKLVGLAVLLMIGLFFWGLYVDFVPSPFWTSLSLKISLELAALLTLLCYWGMWTGRFNMDQYDGFSEVTMAVLFTPVILFFWIWVALEHGCGDLANRTFGKTEIVAMRFELGKYDADEECQRLVGFEEGKNTPIDFCLSYKSIVFDKGNLPQKFSGNISARRSSLGRHRFRLEVRS